MTTFNRWISSALAGANEYIWQAGPELTAEDEELRLAAIELCERRLRRDRCDGETLAKLAILLIGHLPVEHLLVFFLGLEGVFLGHLDVARGSAGSVPVSLHSIARHAIMLGAKFVIVAHQHPRGRELPSEADKKWLISASAALAGAGILISDSLVIAGARGFSMRASRTPASAWVHQPIEADTSTRSAPTLSDADAARLNLGLAAIARHGLTDDPASTGELREIASAWMQARDVSAFGIIACDGFCRPITCRLLDDLAPEGLVEAVRFMITNCAVCAILVVHAPVGEPDLQAIAGVASDFESMLHPFDASCADAICTTPHGAQSLRALGLFSPSEGERHDY